MVKIGRHMKYLLIIILFAGCKCDWYFTKAMEKGCMKRDTTTIIKRIPGGTIKGDLQIFKDTEYLVQLVLKDTCYSKDDVKKEISKAVRNTPCKVEPLHIDTFGVILDVSYSDGKPSYTVQKGADSLQVDCPQILKVETKEVMPWWVKWTWIAAGVAILGLIFKRAERPSNKIS
jgi:hypothetical protein